MTRLIETLISGLSLGSIYALMALGYTMVYGIAKMLNGRGEKSAFDRGVSSIFFESRKSSFVVFPAARAPRANVAAIRAAAVRTRVIYVSFPFRVLSMSVHHTEIVRSSRPLFSSSDRLPPSEFPSQMLRHLAARLNPKRLCCRRSARFLKKRRLRANPWKNFLTIPESFTRVFALRTILRFDIVHFNETRFHCKTA